MEGLIEKKKPQRQLLLINLIGVVILIALFCYFNYSSNKNLEEQNLKNITNLNKTSEELSIKIFENQKTLLENSSNYIVNNRYNIDEAIDFLEELNATEASSFEIIGKDATGYTVEGNDNGQNLVLDYGARDYQALQEIFSTASKSGIGKVNFTPEFTDKKHGVKCFALYTVIPIIEDGRTAYYTLMSLTKSKDLIDMIKVDGDYDNMCTAIVDGKGNYILGDPAFKSTNFFEYLYVFNDLSLDEKNEIKNQMTSSKSGKLKYNDSKDIQCIYIYDYVKDYDWFVITSVPIDNFKGLAIEYLLPVFLIAVLMILFIINIIYLRSLNRKLSKSVERERHASNAKSDFLSRMSHDIRTPLNAIIGFSDIALENEDLTTSLKGDVNKINSSAQYLLSLINDILDMSKIENNKLELREEPIDRLAFIKEIEEIFGEQAELKKINFVTDFSEVKENWAIMDSLRTRQIYSNLLSNAVKFTEAGGTITWKITDSIVDEKKIHTKSTICDTGCGMSETFMENIFTPFEQDKDNQTAEEKGTGLGLSIVKNLIELSGGSVSAESNLGAGSTFTLEIDRTLCAEPENLIENKVHDSNSRSLQGKHVLLCEDHPLNVEIATKLLTKKGIIVECATNGNEGVEFFKRSELHYYDCILMDIRMPIMDGIEATKVIRKMDREDAITIPIIAMTANAFDEDRDNSREAGMNEHLAKPIDTSELYEILEKYMDK